MFTVDDSWQLQILNQTRMPRPTAIDIAQKGGMLDVVHIEKHRWQCRSGKQKRAHGNHSMSENDVGIALETLAERLNFPCASRGSVSRVRKDAEHFPAVTLPSSSRIHMSRPTTEE